MTPILLDDDEVAILLHALALVAGEQAPSAHAMAARLTKAQLASVDIPKLRDMAWESGPLTFESEVFRG